MLQEIVIQIEALQTIREIPKNTKQLATDSKIREYSCPKTGISVVMARRK